MANRDQKLTALRGLFNRIEKILTDITPTRERVERVMNTPIPGTGGRVLYVHIPGSGKNRAALSRRAAEVLAFITKARGASSADLQRGLHVNRNVIAGAIHELKQAHCVEAEATAGEAPPRRGRRVASNKAVWGGAAKAADRSPRKKRQR